MAKGADRTFIDRDVEEHFLSLLSDADKSWGIKFVKGDILPVSLDVCDGVNDLVDGIGYGIVRG